MPETETDDFSIATDRLHHGWCDHLAAYLNTIHPRVEREVRLPDGRIADIVAQSSYSDIIIVELKTLWKPSYAASALEKYGHWCHWLWLAVPYLTLTEQEREAASTAWPEASARVGFLNVNAKGAIPLRLPARYRMTDPRFQLMHSLLRGYLPKGEAS